jgi:hypothetical protein
VEESITNLLPKSSITVVRSFDQIAIININSDGAIQLSLCISLGRG